IGRFVEITASPQEVRVVCDGQVVACHARSWAKHGVVTDPAHAHAAAAMRQALAAERHSRQTATRFHPDGHAVMLRALPDYDALFGVDFDPSAHDTEASSQ
ncbi:Mu transposase domain-containing protein, partial [Microbispora amethystogenes]|uniref:Mu transposase domain-containing protein n=1 Tax=Microbispora amethystogenes TaxID=1427754 RepID=UPI003CD0AE81